MEIDKYKFFGVKKDEMIGGRYANLTAEDYQAPKITKIQEQIDVSPLSNKKSQKSLKNLEKKQNDIYNHNRINRKLTAAQKFDKFVQWDNGVDSSY